MEMFKIVFLIFGCIQFSLVRSNDSLTVKCDPELIIEGSNATVTVYKTNEAGPDLTCFVSISPDSASTDTEVIYLLNDRKLSFNISTSQDGLPNNYHVKLTFDCDNETLTKTIPVDSSDPIVEGDPHFSQLIVDAKTKKVERICYDIFGKSGDYIEIYTHQATKTYIYGQLMDDYYMHIIRLFSSLGNITVSTKYIKYNKELLSLWGESNDIRMYHRGGFMIRIEDNFVDIEIKDSKNIKFRITRSSDPITGYYMDFGVFGLLNYDGIDGLLGRIGNNLLKFYDSVQTRGTSGRGAVLVNGHFAVASKKSESNNCWSVDVRDLLHPYLISNYILSE